MSMLCTLFGPVVGDLGVVAGQITQAYGDWKGPSVDEDLDFLICENSVDYLFLNPTFIYTDC